MKDSFIFYRSFYEASLILDDTSRLKFYDMIFQLGLNSLKVDEQDELVKSLFLLAEPVIEANNKRYEDGKKGGRPKKITTGLNEIKTTGFDKNKTDGFENKKPNKNKNNNYNKNYNEDNNILSSLKIIIDYLNEKTNSNFRYSSKATQTKIKARLNEGYKLDDFYTVIDKKVNEWKNTKMEIYLRPETLFGTKFESYLNQKEKQDVPSWFNQKFEKVEMTDEERKIYEQIK